MRCKYNSSKLCFAIVMIFSVTDVLFQTLSAVAPVARSDLDQSSKAEAMETYGQLPMSFEANQGQADTQVKFLSLGFIAIVLVLVSQRRRLWRRR